MSPKRVVYKRGTHPNSIKNLIKHDAEWLREHKIHLNHPHTLESKKIISSNRKNKGLGDKNFKWKGDKVGYIALHAWVARKLGKPQECSFCGSRDEGTRKYHWANVSRQYKRDLSDWIRLCAKCHYHYDDLGNKRWKNSGGNYAT